MRAILFLVLALTVAGQAHAADWPDLTVGMARTDVGAQDAALIVSIEDYSHVSDVAGAGANARAWRAWFRSRGTPVRMVEDRDAWHAWTRDGAAEGILAEVEQTRRRVGAGGRLWFIFIGHGAPSPDGKDGLLLPFDVQQTIRSVRSKGIPIQSELLKRTGAGAVVILDACFSGRDTAGRSLAKGGLQPLVPVEVREVGASAVVLTAARSDQFAGGLPLSSTPRPAFTYLLLGALQGWGDVDGDRTVTAQEAVDFVDRAFYKLIKDRKQTPTLRGAPGLPLGVARRDRLDLSAMTRPAPAPEPVRERIVVRTERAPLRRVHAAPPGNASSGGQPTEFERPAWAAIRIRAVFGLGYTQNPLYPRRWEQVFKALEKRVASRGPDSSGHSKALYHLMRAYLQSGRSSRIDDAIRTGKAYLAGYPRSPMRAEINFLLGFAHDLKGDAEGARPYYGVILQRHHSSDRVADVLVMLGHAHLTKGELDKADAMFEKVALRFQRDPVSGYAQYARGLVAAVRGRRSDALTFFRLVLKPGVLDEEHGAEVIREAAKRQIEALDAPR